MATPVTVLEVGPCYVTQVKTVATDGYNAIQIGFGAAKRPDPASSAATCTISPPFAISVKFVTDDADQYHVGQVLRREPVHRG